MTEGSSSTDDPTAPEDDHGSLAWSLLSSLPGVDREGTRRFRLLVGLMAVLVPLAVVVTTLIAVQRGGILAPGPLVGVTSTLALLATYGVAARGHVGRAAGLATGIAFAGCVGVLVLPTVLPDPVAYAFFAVPLAMSSLLLPAWATAAVAVLTIAAAPLVAADWFVRGSVATLAAMVGGLLTVGSHLRSLDRKRARAQTKRLEATRTWLHQAQSVAKVGAFSWAPGREPWWSPELYQVLGYQPGAIEASLDAIRDHVHPDDRDRFDRELKSCLETGDPDALTCRMVTGDGRTIDTVWQTDKTVDDDGHPRLVGAVQDVTDRKRAEDLQRRVAAETARSRTLQRLVQIASHEFREPVRTLLTSTGRMDRELDGQATVPLNESLAAIRSAGHRLHQVTDALVRFTEVLAAPLDPEPVDAGQALDDALIRLQGRFEADELPVEAGDLPTLAADRARLVTVFEELVANGLKHGEPPVRVGARKLEDRWELFVQDGGSGVSEEYRDRVFEPFERLHREGWDQHPGLGLSLVRRIVEQHGGTVELGSQPDGSMEVGFTLPGAEDPAEHLGGTVQSQATRGLA